MNLRIKELRELLGGMSQRALAARLGMRPSALSMVESGKNTLSEQTIKLICLSFHVNENWLRGGEGSPFQSSSPCEKEFFDIFQDLLPETQQALLAFAKSLLATQRRLEGTPPASRPPKGQG